MRQNSAQYIHTLTEALKLAYADRDTYYGDPKFVKIPQEELLSQKYADERRKLIGDRASLAFRPGQIAGYPGIHPSLSEIVRTKIDDFLMAHDTTCVDAIDKDGIMFSATPSGAWLPSVIAGDTGIPLTERAQSFLLVPGNPNELAGGKRPRVTLSPTLVTHDDGTPWVVLSTPGGDNQEQSLMQVLFNVILFRMNSEAAIEAPRFETRHLVSSFDNHAMNPGDLQLDDRTPMAVVADLAGRGHKVTTRTRWNSGAAPGMVRLTPGGVRSRGRSLLLQEHEGVVKTIGLLFAAVAAFGQTGAAPAIILTSSSNIPPVGLAPSETAQVNIGNTAGASPVAVATLGAAPTVTGPSCTGSVSFYNAKGAIIGTATSFTVTTGQIASVALPYAMAGASGSRTVIRAVITNSTPITALGMTPCNLSYSLETYDTATGATHVFVSGVVAAPIGPIHVGISPVAP